MALLAAIAVAYAPLRSADFVDFDDDEYVVENPQVQAGLSAGTLGWAFTSTHDGNWIPLVWVSLMLDHAVHGLDARGYHATNVALHALATLLLLAALRRLTGDLAPSAFVAAVFALHPLHVESVAWIAERKDVLSGVFWMAALWGYARYVEAPSPRRYVLGLLVPMALGLMAKATLVTLPCVLLLLDLWPARRIDPSTQGGAELRRRAGRLVAEKLPLLALSLAASIVTYAVQAPARAMDTGEALGLGARLGNAVLAYAAYLGKAAWPTDLIFLYPHPGSELPGLRVAAAAGLLVAVTAACVLAARRDRDAAPCLVGWLWYLGTLVPMSGIVQVGAQAMADRYTYLPLVGIGIAVAWGARVAVRRGWLPAAVAAGAGLVLALAWTAVSHAQARHWVDSEALYGHALAVRPGHAIAHYQMGRFLLKEERWAEAETHLEAFLRARPDSADGHANLGVAQRARGRPEEALASLRRSLALNPRSVAARLQTARVLLDLERPEAAARELERVVALQPERFEAHLLLGDLARRRGATDDAWRHYADAFRRAPGPARAQAAVRMVRLVEGWPDAPAPAVRVAAQLAGSLARTRPRAFEPVRRRLEARARALP